MGSDPQASGGRTLYARHCGAPDQSATGRTALRDLREHLDNPDRQDEAFSADEELTAALMQTGAIEALREAGLFK